MKRLVVILAAVFCSSVAVLGQESCAEGRLKLPLSEKLVRPEVIDKKELSKTAPADTFLTHPMPNAYRGDNCVPLPNAYVGDNSVPMPNVYGGPIIVPNRTDSAMRSMPKEYRRKQEDKKPEKPLQ